MAIACILPGGAAEYPWYNNYIEGFGAQFKRKIKKYYPAPWTSDVQAPIITQPRQLFGPGSRGERYFRDTGPSDSLSLGAQ